MQPPVVAADAAAAVAAAADAVAAVAAALSCERASDLRRANSASRVRWSTMETRLRSFSVVLGIREASRGGGVASASCAQVTIVKKKKRHT